VIGETILHYKNFYDGKKMKINFLLLSSLFIVYSCAGNSELIEIWPTAGWEYSSPEEQKMDGSLLNELNSKIENGDYGYVDGMLIIRNGYVVIDKSYKNDYVKINEGRDATPWIFNY